MVSADGYDRYETTDLPQCLEYLTAPLPSKLDDDSPATLILVPETANNGPSHSEYANAVLPSKITVVSSGKSVISSVFPAGTVNAFKIIVEHDDFDTEADEYPAAPEKVHVAARFSMARSSMARSTSKGLGAGVGAGAASAAGMARTARAAKARRRVAEESISAAEATGCVGLCGYLRC